MSYNLSALFELVVEQIVSQARRDPECLLRRPSSSVDLYPMSPNLVRRHRKHPGAHPRHLGCPGVYLFRETGSQMIRYAGMAGERGEVAVPRVSTAG